ncbi:PAS domain S-box protein [Paraburkholderia caribensis]|uniref:histidine kinase n=1 Tax=Paraburkholderia caribensis TaxID=75105 RepID=A0A9Q6S4Q9_9BURK|nr:PAS domain S-box protein [Paraburkholderia caribensis]MCO4882402.1 PAS domain S-box protein [Paraburkholderia caribensis]PTB23708.1 hybrid sensor histidine kinase/response regulator [Paraburkholderia caribensis]QLB64094.1 hybrid sensor histidine kinase/response regulator [Paraburkholderia caribensis]
MSDDDKDPGSAASGHAEPPEPHADHSAAASGTNAPAACFSSEWLRLWAESTTDYSIFALALDGTIVSWNRGGEAIQGYRPDEILGQHVRVLYTAEDQRAGVPELGLQRAREDGRHEMEGWRVRKDGSLFWANVIITALYAPDGELLGYGRVVRDISDKKKATDAALESDRRFRLLVQGVNDYAIFMLSPEGCVTNWNPGARRIKGYTDEQIIGSHFSCFYTPEDAAAGVPQRGLATAEREGRWEAEGWRVRRDGSRFWAHVVIDAIRDENGVLIGFAKITRDITERRQAAELLDQTRNALFQSQKMEALGKMTGGVAHDFNNVLQVLRGNLELLGARHDDAWSRARIGRAIEAVERGSKLAAQLLAFGRRQALQPVTTDLGGVLHGMDDLLRRALGERVEVRVHESHASGELWNVLVDTHQLESVVLNLAINSRDAMPEGGVLTFGLSNAVLYAQAAVAAQVEPGEYVKMTVTDTGAGMSADVVERAFDPFFTTKPEGQGTGLGLSMAYGFVLQSGGHIELASTPGVGTTVTIYLPRSTDPLIERPLAQSTSESGRDLRGDETVLVVEDDRRVQLTVVDMLSQLGYGVLTANDATEALTVLRSGARVDLLFSDVVMPGPLLSPEMVRQARLIRPSLKVLFTSGHTRDTTGLDAQLRRGADLLQKPYSRLQLARKIREVFDGPARATHDAAQCDTPGKLHILVVEDDRDGRDALCELLGLLGHTWDAVANAEEALKHLQLHPFDVLLTDLTLPGMSGLDLARAAVAMNAARHIVFASGRDVPVHDESLPFTWTALRKPYSFEQLKAVLDAQH